MTCSPSDQLGMGAYVPAAAEAGGADVLYTHLESHG